MKGKVRPLVGKRPVATPTLIKVCRPIKIATPYEIKNPKYKFFFAKNK